METSAKTLRDYTKARLHILKQLRDAGIQEDVPLPRIVAVGIQSVGKSSLLEAISTLKLPRGGGTCTKCPMEFRLENSSDASSLSVNITLRFGKDEESFRSNLSDLKEIRLAIADAQERILNPSLLGRTAIATPGDNARTFSEDCVCVFAKGPNVHDLYFYDIPGVIEDVVDGQDPSQIDLIKNLVKKYVAEPNCIVLLVVSCEYDLEVGGVARLIFDMDPELQVKERTVGVLAKVDKIEDTGPAWLDTFHNKKRKLDNGWFAVKLPAGDDIPWEEARKQEREFFRDNELWKSVDEEGRNRLGSEQLTQYISKLLSNLVADRLPAISQEITKKIDDSDAMLRRIPLHTEQNASNTVHTTIHHFSETFSAHILVGIQPTPFTTKGGLVAQVNKQYTTIRDELFQHTPRFCPTKFPGNGTSASKSSVWTQLCAEGEIVYLDTMIEYIKGAVTEELPGELPYKIAPNIITHHVESWQRVAITGFHNVKALAVEHFNSLLWEHFGQYSRGGFLACIKQILDENINDCATATLAELNQLAKREQVPHTVLQAEFLNLQRTIFQQYQAEVVSDSAPDSPLSFMLDIFETALVANSTTILEDIAGGIISSATRKIFADHLSARTDPKTSLTEAEEDCHNALTVMSYAQAYLEMASKRFAEAVAKCIGHSFLRAVATRVCIAVRAMPANTSPQICWKLVQDPTAVEQRQVALERRNHYARVKNGLDEAMRDLKTDTYTLHGVQVGSQQRTRAPDLSSRDSDSSYAPLSVDCSTPSFDGY